MQKMFIKLGLFFAVAAFVFSGCVQQTSQTALSAESAPVAKEKKTASPVYKGKVVGKSNKAKTISLEVGKGQKAHTIMMKFDDNTKGVNHASKGKKVIVAYENRGKDVYVLSIKPKLAKLPKGVTEIKVDELKLLVDNNVDFELIDSRPQARYAQAHLPDAISIPVCEMQELIGLLPKDNNQLLVLYCGGPT